MKTLQQMSVMGHERLVFHQDPESGLRAIIAIHDSTLGDALGGTRRWCYASEEDAIMDVLRLSEGMTYKAAAADLAMVLCQARIVGASAREVANLLHHSLSPRLPYPPDVIFHLR